MATPEKEKLLSINASTKIAGEIADFYDDFGYNVENVSKELDNVPIMTIAEESLANETKQSLPAMICGTKTFSENIKAIGYQLKKPNSNFSVISLLGTISDQVATAENVLVTEQDKNCSPEPPQRN